MNWLETESGSWVVRNRWWLILTTMLMALCAASGAGRLELNNDTRVFFSERNPQLKAFEALDGPKVLP